MTAPSPTLWRSWQRCWAGVGANSEGKDVYENLLQRHSEPQRKYHTLQHLNECIVWIEKVGHLAKRPHEVEMALWFHDAIYTLQSHENEEQSAGLACLSLMMANVNSDVVERIAQLVLATAHSVESTLHDEQLLVDIDLSILGALPSRFAEYETQIRDEYSFVEEALFRTKRREILLSFLERKRIYTTDLMFNELESQARINLIKATNVE
jgi:predicted metal-dependent HD superfamily phosphohydrolase